MSNSDKTSSSSSLSTKLVCGAVAGVIGTLTIYPIDMIKTRLQNNSSANSSIKSTLNNIVKNEGMTGLYRGLVPNLIGIIPEKAIKLAVNDTVREKCCKYHNKRNPNDIRTPDTIPLKYGMLAGASAGFFQVVATCPMEITKIRMQLATVSGQPTSLSSIVSSLGIRGLYKGSLATLCRDVPFSIVFFSLQAKMKTWFTPESSKGVAPLWAVFSSGILAGIASASLVTPMDVIKTRLQTSVKQGELPYKGMLDAYSRTIRNEGVTALFKGTVPRSMIVAPLFAITVLVYEGQQRYIQARKSVSRGV